MNRSEILDKAKADITQDRQNNYGTPEDNFNRIAAFWSTHKGVQFTAVDVAVMMSLVKVARIHTSPQHADNWSDLAGYAACGGEIGTRAKAALTKTVPAHLRREGFTAPIMARAPKTGSPKEEAYPECLGLGVTPNPEAGGSEEVMCYRCSGDGKK